MNCTECEREAFTYLLNCSECRRRLALAYPCRLLRKQMVAVMEKSYGEVNNWKSGGCDCVKVCKRKANIKIEQSAYAERKETPINSKGTTVRSVRKSRS